MDGHHGASQIGDAAQYSDGCRCNNAARASGRNLIIDDYQIQVPPSFVALYTDRRRRLTVSLKALRDRYDLCEDLAQQLVDFAKGVHHDLGVSEDEVLARCRRGLLAPPAQVEPAEATWILKRLAELLYWPWPERSDDAGASPQDA